MLDASDPWLSKIVTQFHEKVESWRNSTIVKICQKINHHLCSFLISAITFPLLISTRKCNSHRPQIIIERNGNLTLKERRILTRFDNCKCLQKVNHQSWDSLVSTIVFPVMMCIRGRNSRYIWSIIAQNGYFIMRKSQITTRFDNCKYLQ